MNDHIVRWEKHGDILVAVDQNGWKRALILTDGMLHYGYAPLGNPQIPLGEFVDTRKERLKAMLSRAVKGVGG